MYNHYRLIRTNVRSLSLRRLTTNAEHRIDGYKMSDIVTQDVDPETSLNSALQELKEEMTGERGQMDEVKFEKNLHQGRSKRAPMPEESHLRAPKLARTDKCHGRPIRRKPLQGEKVHHRGLLESATC